MRLCPIPPDRLSDEQKPVYEAMKKQIASDPQFSAFVTEGEDGALQGPWNVWLHTPSVGAAIGGLSRAIGQMKALPERVKQIVILTVGARFQAAYELYAHAAIAREDGIDEETIASLIENREPVGLSQNERLAYDAVSALVSGGVLPEPLYQGIWKTFGTEGCAQLIYLTGQYCFVSMTLNGYAQPVPVPRLNS